MHDNMYNIKEASKLLDCTTQNIYRQKDQLIKSGYMELSNTGGYYLNNSGINYLREKRIETMRSSTQDFKQVDKQDLTSVANPTVSIENVEYISLLKEQIQELKIEKEYWKNEYTKKDNELKEKNEYIQGINTKVFALLGTEEDNKKQAEEYKKMSWFEKIFKKDKKQQQ